ncbi:glycoside hydrolase family 2 protein [Streptomyces aculeolatus]
MTHPAIPAPHRRTLHDGWTLTAATGEHPLRQVPATVPGCVHTDLLAAGLIEDPYLEDNELRQRWIGRTDWAYDTTFEWTPDPHERTDLVCDGLDTAATVLLNGTAIAVTANQHRSYRFPVRHLLREGTNTLRITFTSPYAYAEARRAELGERPGAYDEPYQFIRKMACNFGWDWGPTLVTSGIWRPISLESWSTARPAQIRPLVTTEGDDGRVDVHITVERAPGRREAIPITAELDGRTHEATVAADETTTRITLRVPRPRRWSPRGHGAPHRYPLTVRAAGHEWTRRIGFRNVHLDQTDGAFTFEINEAPVVIRGVNWIPDDCFPTRITRERLDQRLQQAADAGVNLLRVWGGGMYESEDFYDLADAYGFLVWQDFPFACAAYPEEEPFRSEVEAEAREHIARLAWRPSLALWCGNNENIEGHADWGWQEHLDDRSWGAGFYYDLLPRIVGELDGTRPYWPGSPYSGGPDLPPNDPARGTVHIWDVWNRENWTHYGTYTPRFVAEFGFQGPPSHATLSRALPTGPLSPDSPGMLHHQKADDGNAKLLKGLQGHLPEPADFDQWHYYTQLNQARAIEFAVTRFRALAPHCTGTIVWQLNDCWPVISWAAIDGDGRKKPLWYALRRAYADRLLTFQPAADGSGLELAVVNDHDEPWHGTVELSRHTISGTPVAKESLPVQAAARSVVRLPVPAAVAADQETGGALLTADLNTARSRHFCAPDAVSDLPTAAYDAAVEPHADGHRVTVTARTLIRDLTLFPDRLAPDATVDDMLVTLLPGETAVFHVDREVPNPELLTRKPILRCVNEE